MKTSSKTENAYHMQWYIMIYFQKKRKVLINWRFELGFKDYPVGYLIRIYSYTLLYTVLTFSLPDQPKAATLLFYSSCLTPDDFTHQGESLWVGKG